MWNEKFVFNIDERPETIDEATLEIEVEDWDQISGNDFMGKVNKVPCTAFVCGAVLCASLSMFPDGLTRPRYRRARCASC